MQPDRFDIAVVGAGPAGATAARLLCHTGRLVALIDPGQAAIARLEILAPSSMGVVHALQLEQALLDPTIARPCAGIRRRWASQRSEFDDFLSRPGGQGFVIDRTSFDGRLRALAFAAGAIKIDGRLLDIHRNQDGFELIVKSGVDMTRVSTSLVIDASGRPAAAACRLGAKRIVNERLIAERELLDKSGAASQEAVWLDVESRERGWSYSIFGPDGRRESWSVHPGDNRRTARDRVVNASAAYLAQAAGRGWIAVGDAAAAFDPIASQGLANALSSAMVSAGAIVSEGGITAQVALNYSGAMLTTFEHSERGRDAVYEAIRRLGAERHHQNARN